MDRIVARRPVGRAEYDTLRADLDKASSQLLAAFEDAAEEMRGWSDIAEKAAFAASIAMLRRRVANAESSLAAVFPDDDIEQVRAHRDLKKRREIDEIVARAWANADHFRHEVWDDGRCVREVPIEDGPCDPAEVARRLCADGVVGELRVIRGVRGAPEERRIAVYPLSSRRAPETGEH